jgi:hypothetical protein
MGRADEVINFIETLRAPDGKDVGMLIKLRPWQKADIRAVYDPATPKDSLTQDSLQKASDMNIKRGYLFALNFALNNKEYHIAPYIALKEVPDANKIYLDSINNSLSPEVANGKYGRALQEYLEEKKN